jgi:hypothetical protein
MYSFAKLLTEEPEKLERLGILFLKILITLFIGSVFFGFNISIAEFFENPIPKGYTISNFILFLISLIFIWYVVWILIAELILGEITIWLLSKIGNKKYIFTEVLSLLKVVKKDNKNLSPEENVITFNEMLQNYTEEDEKDIKEGKSRLRQYYIVATVIYITLLCSKDIILPCWLKWVSPIMVTNILIASVVLNQIHNYFTENLDEMKKQFSLFAFAQMANNAIDKNPFIKHHYKRIGLWNRIRLERKTEDDRLPNSFNFFPLYYWNDSLTKAFLDKGLQQRAEKDPLLVKKGTHFDVIVSNVKPDDENIKSILSQPGFVYLHCEDEEQIYMNLEVLLFKVTKGMYRII